MTLEISYKTSAGNDLRTTSTFRQKFQRMPKNEKNETPINFPIAVSNAENHTVATVIEPREGNPLEITDEKGLPAQFEYDVFGREIERWYPDFAGATKTNDPLFRFQQWNANLRILEVTEVKTVPYVPLSHPFVARLIGTIRREFLDQIPFWSAADLERKLLHFKDYYNRERVHQGIGGQLPDPRPAGTAPNIAYLDNYRWKSCCRGLYQLPIAA